MVRVPKSNPWTFSEIVVPVNETRLRSKLSTVVAGSIATPVIGDPPLSTVKTAPLNAAPLVPPPAKTVVHRGVADDESDASSVTEAKDRSRVDDEWAQGTTKRRRQIRVVILPMDRGIEQTRMGLTSPKRHQSYPTCDHANCLQCTLLG